MLRRVRACKTQGCCCFPFSFLFSSLPLFLSRSLTPLAVLTIDSLDKTVPGSSNPLLDVHPRCELWRFGCIGNFKSIFI